MKFSVCIPNFNYGNFIGETIESVLAQDFEIVITDNCSTDNSWEVIQKYVANDSRVRAFRNKYNLGFAGNLDRVTSQAKNEFLILLSSDDIMNKGTLRVYRSFYKKIGLKNNVITSSCSKVGDENNGYVYGPRKQIWKDEDVDEVLSKEFGFIVYKAKANEILKRSLSTFSSPLHFPSTCYASDDYEAVGGYGGAKLTNPDKWFHLKLLSEVEYAYNLDFPFFSYRWHDGNQTAQIKKSGAMKYFLDEYRTTFEIGEETLEKIGLSKDDLEISFVNNVIHKFAYRNFRDGQTMEAFRIFSFGLSCYPYLMLKRTKSYLLFVLIISGRLGRFILRFVK